MIPSEDLMKNELMKVDNKQNDSETKEIIVG